MKRYVYLYPVNETPFSVFLDLAVYMNRHSEYTSVFLLSLGLEKYSGLLSQMNIEYIKVGNANNPGENARKGLSSLLKEFLLKKSGAVKNAFDFVRTTSLFMIIDFMLELKRLKRDYHIAVSVFEKKVPHALILYGDRHLGFEQALIKLFKDKDLPSIIIPVATSDPEASVYLRRNNREFFCSGIAAPLLNRVAKHINYGWVYKLKGKEYLFYSSGKALAGYFLDMISLNPWYIGGGHSTLVGVESEEIKKRYLKFGIPEEKIIVTGHPSHDHLFEKYNNRDLLKKEVCKKYDFNERNKLIICAVPHMAEHNIITWDTHWVIINLLVQNLAKTGHNILLSLHPKSGLNKYQLLEKKYACRISDEPLKEILAAADIFVATFSSTLQWAIICRIPFIIVDFYKFNYTFLDHISGIIKVTNGEDFISALKRIIDDEKYYAEIKMNLDKYGSLTPFDGLSRKRIIQVIELLVKKEEYSSAS